MLLSAWQHPSWELPRWLSCRIGLIILRWPSGAEIGVHIEGAPCPSLDCSQKKDSSIVVANFHCLDCLWMATFVEAWFASSRPWWQWGHVVSGVLSGLSRCCLHVVWSLLTRMRTAILSSQALTVFQMERAATVSMPPFSCRSAAFLVIREFNFLGVMSLCACCARATIETCCLRVSTSL